MPQDPLMIPLLSKISATVDRISSLITASQAGIRQAVSSITQSITAVGQAMSAATTRVINALGKSVGRKDSFPIPGPPKFAFEPSEGLRPLTDPFQKSLFSTPGFGQGGGGMAMPDASSLNLGALFKTALAPIGKTLKTTFAGVGKTLLSSFGPMTILFQILSPMISAFLEPLSLLEPLFSAWGTILSQLLIPIIMALMEALMPITPLLIDLVTSLMPIIMILPGVIHLLMPPLTMAIEFIRLLVNIIGVAIAVLAGAINAVLAFFTMISQVIYGGVNNLLAGVNEFFNNVKAGVTGFFTDVANIFINGGQRIKDFFTGLWDDITGFFKKDRDNNPNTFW